MSIVIFVRLKRRSTWKNEREKGGGEKTKRRL